MKNIFFRLDAGEKPGLGHLFRSISISQELKSLGLNAIFLISENNFTITELENQHFRFILKPEMQSEEQFLEEIVGKETGDLLFIDKIYPYSSDFIRKLKKSIKVLMFHSVWEGSFFADIFILPSAHTDFSIIENPVWKENRVKFYHGAEYVVLNDKAHDLRKRRESLVIDEKKIVITTGGSDPEGVLLQILHMIKDENFPDYRITALYGSAFAKKRELSELIPQLPGFIEVKEFSFDEIVDAQIVLSTFGVSTYEFLHAGIPVLSVGHAPANAEGSKNLETRFQTLVDLGFIGNLAKQTFLRQFTDFISNKDLLISLSSKGKRLIDGQGHKRVAKIIQDAI